MNIKQPKILESGKYKLLNGENKITFIYPLTDKICNAKLGDVFLVERVGDLIGEKVCIVFLGNREFWELPPEDYEYIKKFNVFKYFKDKNSLEFFLENGYETISPSFCDVKC